MEKKLYTLHLIKFTSKKNGFIKFPKKVNLDIKTRLSSDITIQHLRIIPKGVGYTIAISYYLTVQPPVRSSNHKAAIDLGSRNIITLVDNIGNRPIVIKDDGKGIKSVTQYFMKKRANLNKIYEKQDITNGKSLQKLVYKYELKKSDQIHKISKFIVQECARRNIGILVIGYNKNWKQNVNLGKQNNQTFSNIPFLELISKVSYKAKERGIKVQFVEESYTSKCSFLDDEEVEKHDSYKGKRIKQGLFYSSEGHQINADVNAAYNILIKSDPYALKPRSVSGVGGYVVYPFRWSTK
jgi:putative transposase